MFQELLNFFLNANHKPFWKGLTFVLIILVFFFVDYFFRFSDSYITDSKLNQITKIQTLLKNECIDDEIKKELLKIQKQIIYRITFWERCSIITTEIYKTYSKRNSFLNVNSDKKKDLSTSESSYPVQRNLFWHFLSSSWFLLISMIIFPIILIYEKNAKSKFETIFMFEIIFSLFAIIYSYFLAFVPILLDVRINYFINFVSIFILSGIFISLDKFLKKFISTPKASADL